MSNVVAIIPARGGSKGIPRKNIIQINGRPLIEWTIEFALMNPYIDRCIVSTDSQEISEVAARAGAEIPYLRSAALSTDTAQTSDVLLDVIQRCALNSDDIIVLLEPTSPYRTSEDFNSILALLKNRYSRKAVSVSIAKSEAYSFQLIRSSSQDGALSQISDLAMPNDLRRQDVKPTCYLDGTFYLSYVQDFIAQPGFLDSTTGSIVSNALSRFEIDDPTDLVLYDMILKLFN